jgi:hypothetical protein
VKRALAAAAAVVLGAAALTVSVQTPDEAMPIFAQAYGVDCSMCHTAVPALNAYGRYVQRSAYGALDSPTLKRVAPVWLGEQASYDTQNPNSPHQVKFGNLALHAAGAVNANFTYHVQQWLVQNEQPGGLDTAWVAFNGLFHRDGHLSIGKIEAPAPSPYSQWADVTGFGTPSLTVGEHIWQSDANRWGAKLGYLRDDFDIEAGYLGSDADLNGFTNFTPANGKAFQWRTTYARPGKPFEAGFYGSNGSVPLPEGGVDRFSSIAVYAQRDPVHQVPGVFAVYQRGYDANPGAGNGAAASRAYSIEVYKPLFRGDALIGVRPEMTDDGLGTITHSANIDLTVRFARFLRAYGEVGLQQNGKPAWRWFLWWTTPLAATHSARGRP